MSLSKEQPRILLFVGRSGCGKGTQVSFLKRDFGFGVVSTGKLLRERAENDDYTGKGLKKGLEDGFLVPTPIVVELWIDEFEKLQKKENLSAVVLREKLTGKDFL